MNTLGLITFLLSTGIQLCYALLFKIRNQRLGINELELPAVSIIICAKNEIHNLQQFLPSVLTQAYPPNLFEVIVVNDGSIDGTQAALSTFQKKYEHLKVVTIETDATKNLPGKKHALAQGIKAAKHDRLLLTDADCKPSSDQWLREMTSIDADIVLGYGAYESHPGILNKFIRWETAHTCMQYASYANADLTYMGVGRNLSYRKSSLKNVENDLAFQEIYALTPSGDDDLLISKLAANSSTSVCLDKDAHTISIPQKTWKTWWKQKTRHASTGKYYPEKVRNLLGLYALSHSLFWLCGIILMLQPMGNSTLKASYGLVVSLFILRMVLYWWNAFYWFRQLNEKKLFYFYPLGDLGWALYNVFLSPYIFWKNRGTWK